MVATDSPGRRIAAGWKLAEELLAEELLEPVVSSQ